MLVPRYWAEGRIQRRERDRQITVRRFGWSDISQEEAQAHADARTHEAFARVAAGAKLPRRERKLPYNSAEGIPIREEIIGYHGTAVITRNIYGAYCLNTPEVLFADVDFAEWPNSWWVAIAHVLCAVLAGYALSSWKIGLAALTVLLPLSLWLADRRQRHFQRMSAQEEKQIKDRFTRFISRHPDWHLRIYQTPAGFRVLVMHQVFDSREAKAAKFFRALGTDRLYVQLCQNQRCFRARVSPKPWRMGIKEQLRPRPGVWPVHPDRMPERVRWIEAYEQAARGFASCRFIETLGSSDTMHPSALAVQKVHDELCQAHTSLPIA